MSCQTRYESNWRFFSSRYIEASWTNDHLSCSQLEKMEELETAMPLKYFAKTRRILFTPKSSMLMPDLVQM